MESSTSSLSGASGTSAPTGTTFNTHRYSQMLQAEGFTEAQADAVLGLVTEAVSESMENVLKAMVTKREQTEELQDAESDFAQLRSEINTLEKRDFAVLRGELERIGEDVRRMKDGIREEISRVHGGVRLDINLEKARMQDEAGSLVDMVVKAEARIDDEINALTKRMIEIRDGTKAWLRQSVFIIFGAFCAYKFLSTYQNSKTVKR
ncbi:hypothetical protein BC832DRAFT_588362 [Gaertneriomyces semiglobifer]|nr:hypothetical protein BC832DRAFT_588362 [Gaertneriomyces semiglobifer]